MARSVFYYHLSHMDDNDGYDGIREHIKQIYDKNHGRYGYRRICMELRSEDIVINHKTVQKLMNQMGLKAKIRKRHYHSYKGEIGKIAPNVLERDFCADRPNHNIAKDVYLSDLYIAADDANAINGKEDLSNAIRFHIASDDGVNQKNFLISKNGGSIATNGKLDLDGDGNIDQAYTGNKYGFGDGNQLVDVIYGEGNQVAYAAKVQDGILVGTNDEDLGLNNIELDGVSKSIGKTLAGSSAYLEVVITIWVEGWQEFAGSPIWDANYIDSQFDIGFEFATDID